MEVETKRSIDAFSGTLFLPGELARHSLGCLRGCCAIHHWEPAANSAPSMLHPVLGAHHARWKGTTNMSV
jgi:hypothetical protein